MGFTAEQIAEALPSVEEAAEEGEFTLLPENGLTMRVYCIQSGRWERNHWTGRALCLHLPSVESTMRMMRVPMRQRDVMLEDLLAMQKAALPVMNKAFDESE